MRTSASSPSFPSASSTPANITDDDDDDDDDERMNFNVA